MPTTLVLERGATGAPLTLLRCEAVGQGGAAIELASVRIKLRMAEKQNGRAWTQPLYEKRPKQPKQSQPQKPEPPSDPAPSGDTPAQ